MHADNDNATMRRDGAALPRADPALAPGVGHIVVVKSHLYMKRRKYPTPPDGKCKRSPVAKIDYAAENVPLQPSSSCRPEPNSSCRPEPNSLPRETLEPYSPVEIQHHQEIGSEWCKEGRRGGKCDITCESLIDDDIRDDANCAQKVFDMEGFKYWSKWEARCKGHMLPDIEKCPDWQYPSPRASPARDKRMLRRHNRSLRRKPWTFFNPPLFIQ
ncbi:hypothetical protein evm_003224 [Chilo suppressalis]|nr:hypothetical protein evm_003224 [Chilo suppressalis]